jgi:hypothetical protein
MRTAEQDDVTGDLVVVVENENVTNLRHPTYVVQRRQITQNFLFHMKPKILHQTEMNPFPPSPFYP